MEVVTTKAVALVVMALVTLGMGLLPLYVRKRLFRHMHKDKGQLVLTGCLCFGAGVLLSIVFLHLLAETQEGFEYAMENGYMAETSYPLAQVTIICGFFVVYFIEELIHGWVEGQHKREEDEDQVTHYGPTSVEEAKKQAQAKRSGQNRLSEIRQSTTSTYSAVASVSIMVGMSKGHDNHAFDGDNGDTIRHNVHTIPHCHHDDKDHHVGQGVSVVGSVVVVIALSFHGIMEGLALGLEEESGDVWILMAALLAHKIVISFSMAMELLEVGMSLLPFFISMLMFALASPIGGLVGTLVLHLSPQETAVSVLVPTILQAISGGTILYVTFCEVLERERHKNKGGWVRLAMLVLGFGVMAGLEAVAGHEHGHHKDTSPTATTTTTATMLNT